MADMDRPLGVAVVAALLALVSLVLFFFTGIGMLFMLLTRPGDFLLSLPMTIFQLFLMALPGIIGWRLWNMESSARVTCVVALSIGAVLGLAWTLHVGLLGLPFYFFYLLFAVPALVYLNRQKVKKAFSAEISVIGFKDL